MPIFESNSGGSSRTGDLLRCYSDDGSTLVSKIDINGKGTFQTLTLANLPTSDPVVAGQVWNSSGTLKISAG